MSGFHVILLLTLIKHAFQQQTPYIPSQPISSAPPPILINATLAQSSMSVVNNRSMLRTSYFNEPLPFPSKRTVQPKTLPCPPIDNTQVDPHTLMPLNSPTNPYKVVFQITSTSSFFLFFFSSHKDTHALLLFLQPMDTEITPAKRHHPSQYHQRQQHRPNNNNHSNNNHSGAALLLQQSPPSLLSPPSPSMASPITTNTISLRSTFFHRRPMPMQMQMPIPMLGS